MLRKIGAIAWKELYLTYTDRNALLVMIATPLVLSTIIGLAFGRFFGGGSDVPISDIPVIVVNQDEGVQVLNTTTNNGEIFETVLVPDGEPDADNILHQLTDAVAMDDPAAARAAVDSGDYAAAILIPPDFSRKLTVTPDHLTPESTSVEVYASPGSPVTGNVVRSIAESIANQIATGSVTIAVTLEQLIGQIADDPLLAVRMTADFDPDFAPAYDPASLPLQIEQQTVQGEAAGFNPLLYFGASIAVFFMMFTAQEGANSVLVERRDGTLQRLLVTPTPRIAILLGKLVGTFANSVLQLVLLFICLTVVGSVMSGTFQFIWGNNLALVALAIVAAALGASGLGTLITSVAKTPEQGSFVGGTIVLAMGVFGGAFFNTAAVPALQPITRLTVNFWATDTFTRLALGDVNIGLNLLVLLGLGGAMFLLGLAIFNRRVGV